MSVVVIGGGFSGAMTAAQLAARGIATTVVEPNELGRGVAYTAAFPTLLLNTPAAQMSAQPDVPGDFVDWLARRHGTATFAPRALYGEYVDTTARALAGRDLEIARTRAMRVDRVPHGFAIACADGSRLTARAVVLALGNAPARRPAAVDASPCYLGDPYAALATIPAAADEPIALLGTGLTALDVIATLRARGHRGPITAVSRRGLVPAAHDLQPYEPISVPRELVRQPRLHALLAWWRSRRLRDIREVAIVAALRPLLPVLWRRLPDRDRERFARHVRPRWDVVRHRAPPAVRAILDHCVLEGSLEIVAARLVATAAIGDRIRCTFAGARGVVMTRDVRWLVNCTGPERDVRRQRSPLVDSLLAARMIEPDALGLGVATAEHGELVTRAGIQRDVYAVGPWRAADLWESTAVPELRNQAVATAEAVVDAFAAARLRRLA